MAEKTKYYHYSVSSTLDDTVLLSDTSQKYTTAKANIVDGIDAIDYVEEKNKGCHGISLSLSLVDTSPFYNGNYSVYLREIGKTADDNQKVSVYHNTNEESEAAGLLLFTPENGFISNQELYNKNNVLYKNTLKNESIENVDYKTSKSNTIGFSATWRGQPIFKIFSSRAIEFRGSNIYTGLQYPAYSSLSWDGHDIVVSYNYNNKIYKDTLTYTTVPTSTGIPCARWSFPFVRQSKPTFKLDTSDSSNPVWYAEGVSFNNDVYEFQNHGEATKPTHIKYSDGKVTWDSDYSNVRYLVRIRSDYDKHYGGYYNQETHYTKNKYYEIDLNKYRGQIEVAVRVEPFGVVKSGKTVQTDGFEYTYDIAGMETSTTPTTGINNLAGSLIEYKMYQASQYTSITLYGENTISNFNYSRVGLNCLDVSFSLLYSDGVKAYAKFNDGDYKEMTISTEGVASITSTIKCDKKSELRVKVVHEYVDDLIRLDYIDTSSWKLETPNYSITQNSVADITLSWNTIQYADRYICVLDATKRYDTGKNNILDINGLTKGTHKFQVIAVYDSDTSYNSDTLFKSITLDKLETPTLTKEDTNIESTQIPYITLKWNQVPFASISTQDKGTFYRLRRVFNEVESTPFSQLSTTNQRVNGDLADNNDLGSYKWQVQAYYTEDSAYDSDWSNIISYEILLIDTPTNFIYDTTTIPGKYRTYLTWNKPTNADMSRLRIYGENTDIIRSTANSYFNLYDINILEPGDYTVKLTAYSNNHYYYRESTQENAPILIYHVNRLDTPGNIKWNKETNTLSWDSVTGANYYQVYSYDGETETLLYETTETSYVNDFGVGLYTLKVYAKYKFIYNDIDYTTQLEPKIITSIPTEITFGTLQAPSNLLITYSSFSSTAKLSWDIVKNSLNNVNADGYLLKLYVDDVYDNVPRNTATNSYTIDRSICPVSTNQYKWTIQAYYDTTIDNETVRIYSAETTVDSWSFKVQQLEVPLITWTEGKCFLSFSAVSNANRYRISANNTPTEFTTNKENLDVRTLNGVISTSENFYTISVSASNTNKFLYQRSITTSSTRYEIYKLQEPTNLKVSDGNISWNNPNTFSIVYKYVVHIDGQYEEDGITKDFSEQYETLDTIMGIPDLKAGNYSTWVQIQKNNGTLEDNPKYIDSTQPSIKLSFGVLPKPVLQLNNNIVSWENIEGADYYEIYDGDDLLLKTNENMYEILSTIPKTFNIKVWARSYSSSINDENSFSDYLLFTFYRLNTPQIYFESETVISWVSVSSNAKYEIYIDGRLRTTTANNSFNLQSVLLEGISKIYIRAVSDFVNYLPSSYSNTLSYKFRIDAEYVATIEGVQYPINKPSLSLKFVKDETLDGGQCTLQANDIIKRFEKKTPIHISIYPINEQLEEQKNEIIGWDFLIAEDNVSEVFLSNKVLYEHNIIMEDITAELQSEFLTDFTITQSLEIVRAGLKEEVIAQPKGNYIVNDTEQLFETIKEREDYRGGYLLHIYKFYLYDKAFGQNIEGVIYDNYNKGDVIILPNVTDSEYGWYLKRKYYKQASTGYTGESYFPSDDEIVFTGNKPLVRHWKIINKDSGEIVYSGGTSTKKTSQYTIPDSWSTGNYQLTLSIEAPTYYVPIPILKNAYSGDRKETGKVMTSKTSGSYIDYSVSWDFTVGELEPTKTNVITIYDAIEKAVNRLNPRKYKDGVWTDRKYVLPDKNGALSKYLNQECPKEDFTNLKSLYDVLLELGRNFNGIPKLIYNEDGDKEITYKVQDKTIFGNNNFKEPDVLYSRQSSDLANSATSFISKLSNIVSTRRTIQYPSGNMWIKARSDNDNDPTITRESSAIVLPYPIYDIKKVLVTNCLVGYSNPIDITAYVYENSHYNTLKPNEEEKGTALTYNQYDNKIRGIGILSEASEMYKLFGWSSTKYVIQNILQKIYPSAQLKDVKDYEYRVIYTTLTDATITTELSNINGIKYPNSKAFNQDATLISDIRFGGAATTQLKRLGNETILCTYRLMDYLALPYVGQNKVYNGDKYYADIITYKFENTYADVSVQYSKNYTSINPRVGVNSEYRLFRIYADNYVRSDININNYCYISTQKYTGIFENENNRISSSLLKSLQGTPESTPSAFYIKPLEYTYNNSGDISGLKRLTTTDYYGNTKEINASLLFADYKEFENSFLISAKMQDNYSAGKASMTAILSEYAQKDVPYVNINGNCDAVDISICSPKESQLVFLNDDTWGNAALSSTLPAVKTINNINTNTLDGLLYNATFEINKDNRECLGFNYQLHCLTYDKNITIHKGLIEHFFKRDEDPNDKPKLYLFKKDYSDIPYLDLNDEVQYVYTPTFTLNNNSIVMSSQTVLPDNDYNGYALVWPLDRNEIIFSYSTPITKGKQFVVPNIYFNISSEKIEYKEK